MSRVTVLIEHDDGRLERLTGTYERHAVQVNDEVVVYGHDWRHVDLSDPRTPEPTP